MEQKTSRIANILVVIFLLVLGIWLFTKDHSIENKEVIAVVTSAPQQLQKDHGSHGSAVADDRQFISQMIPHHEEAVTTSEIVVNNSTNTELTAFATEVISVQTREIEQMKQWHKQWFGEEFSWYSAYTSMMGDLTKLQGTELEKAYIEGMISHHNGAIEMAEQILKITKRPEIKKMAEDIILVQSEEVTMLKNMLSNYPSTL